MPSIDTDCIRGPKYKGPGIFEYLDYYNFWSEPRSVGDTCAANGILLSKEEIYKLEKLNTAK